MLRILTFAVLVALIAVASSLYSLAQNVQQQERRAARLNAEIAREENAIRPT